MIMVTEPNIQHEAELINRSEESQVSVDRLEIFRLILGKQHPVWHWEWGQISAPNLSDREPWKGSNVQSSIINFLINC